MEKNKTKLIAIICGIVGIALIIFGYLFNSEKTSNKVFTNDDYNINNNGGSVAVKIDDYYYVMGQKFFVKIDKDNNIVTDIGKANNTTSFDYDPYMQVYGDYIYYAVGGAYKYIYRYNYKTNNIELYTEPKDVISDSAIISTYFIRGDKLYYQPYSEDYYYSINLKDNSFEKLNKLGLSAIGVVMSYNPNMYGNNIIYSVSKKLNYFDVEKNELKTIISHDCSKYIVYNNHIYYEYDGAIYKANMDGTNETLVYDGDYTDFLTVYENYLYVSKGYSAKIIDIKTGEEINKIETCKNYSIAVDKFICTDYRNNNAYSYNLDGSNQQLIYDNSKAPTENSSDKNNSDNNNKNETENKNESINNNNNQNNNTNNDQSVGNNSGTVSNNITFTADVYFLTKAEGGRHTPFFSNTKFQYKFGDSSMYNGSFKFADRVEMGKPGDNLVLTITISSNENISIGNKFNVYETNGRLVGNGTVKEIVK